MQVFSHSDLFPSLHSSTLHHIYLPPFFPPLVSFFPSSSLARRCLFSVNGIGDVQWLLQSGGDNWLNQKCGYDVAQHCVGPGKENDPTCKGASCSATLGCTANFDDGTPCPCAVAEVNDYFAMPLVGLCGFWLCNCSWTHSSLPHCVLHDLQSRCQQCDKIGCLKLRNSITSFYAARAYYQPSERWMERELRFKNALLYEPGLAPAIDFSVLWVLNARYFCSLILSARPSCSHRYASH